jgi:hypothetical protein
MLTIDHDNLDVSHILMYKMVMNLIKNIYKFTYLYLCFYWVQIMQFKKRYMEIKKRKKENETTDKFIC